MRQFPTFYELAVAFINTCRRFDFDPLAVTIMFVFWIPGFILLAVQTNFGIASAVGLMCLGATFRKNYE